SQRAYRDRRRGCRNRSLRDLAAPPNAMRSAARGHRRPIHGSTKRWPGRPPRVRTALCTHDRTTTDHHDDSLSYTCYDNGYGLTTPVAAYWVFVRKTSSAAADLPQRATVTGGTGRSPDRRSLMSHRATADLTVKDSHVHHRAPHSSVGSEAART